MNFNSWDEFIDVVSTCQKCALCSGRTQVVPGAGNIQADVVFVGEGPGKQEDLQGVPFIGRSGKLLTEMLGSIGLSREDIYIANMVKCRPPENRDPLPAELEACDPYLEYQIAHINPKVIVTLGRFSLAKFLPGIPISEAHGQVYKRDLDDRVVFPMYHPAVGLYKASMRESMLEDFQKLKSLLSSL